MNAKNKKTLAAIFARPVSPGIKWADIEHLFVALGADVFEGAGSRVRVSLNGEMAVFHRPHPSPDTDKGAVVAVRKFLKIAGVET